MATRVLLIPGGTAIGAVALAHAGLHKIVELAQERAEDPDHPAPHTVVVLRDPALVPPATLRGAALDPSEALPEFADVIAQDPSFFDGVDLIIETSGSTTGSPRHVGLSVDAILASIDATHEVFDGPGVWILALPAHHIAGAMVLLRSTRHDFPPRIVDTSNGFHPESLLPAIRGALSHNAPAYLSLVPAQLRKVFEFPEVVAALGLLSAVLVGGQVVPSELLAQARGAGIRVHTSYGMSETCGGVVYDGHPLPGVKIRILDSDSLALVSSGGQGRIAISSPTLMTRYLEGEDPWFEIDGERFLLTNDWGCVDSDGVLSVLGRVDDVVNSGGVNVLPSQVEDVVRSFPGVADVWVGGVEDSRWGSVVAALVVCDACESPDDSWFNALYEYVKFAGGKAWAPRVVAAVSELPTLGSGKVDRRSAAVVLRDALEVGQAWTR